MEAIKPNNLYIQSKLNMQSQFHTCCSTKKRLRYQSIQEIATKEDLMISGYNLNQIVKKAQPLRIDPLLILQIYDLPIHDQLVEYLTDQHLSTCQQNLASLVLANIYFVGTLFPPSQKLTTNLINIIQKGTGAAIGNCLALLNNAVIKYPQWREKLVNQYDICDVLCRTLSSESTFGYTSKILRAMLVISQNSPPHQSFKKYFDTLVPYLSAIPSEDIELQDKFIIMRACVCFYWLTQIFPQEASEFVINHNLYEKIEACSLCCKLFHIQISCVCLRVLQIMLQNNKSIQNQANLLQKMVQLMKRSAFIQFRAAFPILVKIVEQQKVSAFNLVKIQYFENQLKTEIGPDILYCLIKIYSMAQRQAKDHQFTQKVRSMFQQVKCRRPKHVELIKFIDESINRFYN